MQVLLKIVHNRISLAILLSLFCLSCRQMVNTNAEDFTKTWQSVENPLLFKATLSINEDGTFSYTHDAELGKGFSNGDWVIKNSYLILSSEKPDSCYYIAEYGKEWSIVTDSVMDEGVSTTIKGCIPDKYTEFVVFEADSFYIRNDSLFHSSEPNELFPFYTNVFW